MTVRALVGHPRLLAGIAARAAIIWALLRLALLMLGALSAFLSELENGTSPAGGPIGAFLVATCVGLCMIDARVIGETLLLRNLGLPGWWPALVSGVVAAVLEILLQLVA